MKQLLLNLFLIISIFTLFIKKSHAQKLVHVVQLNSGLVSQTEADIYAGKLDYHPTLQLANDKFRLSLNAGAIYLNKSVDLIGGVNVAYRVKNFSTLNDNLPFGGIFIKAGFELASSSEKIISTAVLCQLSQIGLNISYGRDLEFDNNWINCGFSFLFRKLQSDPYE